MSNVYVAIELTLPIPPGQENLELDDDVIEGFLTQYLKDLAPDITDTAIAMFLDSAEVQEYSPACVHGNSEYLCIECETRCDHGVGLSDAPCQDCDIAEITGFFQAIDEQNIQASNMAADHAETVAGVQIMRRPRT